MATLPQKIKLLKGLLKGRITYTGPFYVTLDITRRCNLQCLGCVYHSPYVRPPSGNDSGIPDIPLQLVGQLCKDLRTIGTPTLVIQGAGEPLLHPDFPALITTVKTAGFNTVLLTNGTLLEENLIRTLIDIGFDLIKVALWAASAEQYEQNHPGTNPGNFRKVVDGVKLAARLKSERKSKFPVIGLHFPINRNNFREIKSMADLALNTGSNELSFALMYSANDTLDSYLLCPEEEKSLREELIRVKQSLRSLPLRHNIPDVLLRYELGKTIWQKMPCYIPWVHARVKVDGTVHPCSRCNLVMGDLHQDTFDHIWNGSAFCAFRKKAFEIHALDTMPEHCDCSFCCFAADNARIHRILKWFLPFLHHRGQEPSCPEA